MFSREDVSAFINQHFEPAWEMVRPVPIVRIDFGNGNVATRTLRGNVASYVCGADGQIVDILPGIYTPAAYTVALARPRDLTQTLSRVCATSANRVCRVSKTRRWGLCFTWLLSKRTSRRFPMRAGTCSR